MRLSLAIACLAGVAFGHELVMEYCQDTGAELGFCDEDGMLRFNRNLLEDPDHPCHEWEENRDNKVCATAILEQYCDFEYKESRCNANNNALQFSKSKQCSWDRKTKRCYLKDSFDIEDYPQEYQYLYLFPRDDFGQETAAEYVERNQAYCLEESESYAEDNGLNFDGKGNFKRGNKLLKTSEVTSICNSFGKVQRNNGMSAKYRCKRYFQRCINAMTFADLTGGYSDLRTFPPTNSPTPYPTNEPTTPAPTDAPTTAAPTEYTLKNIRAQHEKECNMESAKTACLSLKIYNDQGQERYQCKYIFNRCSAKYSDIQYNMFFSHLLTESPTPTPTTGAPTAPTTPAPTDAEGNTVTFTSTGKVADDLCFLNEPFTLLQEHNDRPVYFAEDLCDPDMSGLSVQYAYYSSVHSAWYIDNDLNEGNGFFAKVQSEASDLRLVGPNEMWTVGDLEGPGLLSIKTVQVPTPPPTRMPTPSGADTDICSPFDFSTNSDVIAVKLPYEAEYSFFSEGKTEGYNVFIGDGVGADFYFYWSKNYWYVDFDLNPNNGYMARVFSREKSPSQISPTAMWTYTNVRGQKIKRAGFILKCSTRAPTTSEPTTLAPTDTPTTPPSMTDAPTPQCDIECGQFTHHSDVTGKCEVDEDNDWGFGDARPKSIQKEIDRKICAEFTYYDAEEEGCVADLYAIAHTVNRGYVLYDEEQSKFYLDTPAPTEVPTEEPTAEPTDAPSAAPTTQPTLAPTDVPTDHPTEAPTVPPTDSPTNSPTSSPTRKPTKKPTKKPTRSPTEKPTPRPTGKPTKKPTHEPTTYPTRSPTQYPTRRPTFPYNKCHYIRQKTKCNKQRLCTWVNSKCRWTSWVG